MTRGSYATFSVSRRDVWSALVGRTCWQIRGSVLHGDEVRRGFGPPGRYTVMVSRSDDLGKKTTVTRKIKVGH